VEWYLDERGWTLSAKARAWLDAVQASWLSIWEVDSVEPGRIVLFDVLTGAERTVHEVAAARKLRAGLVMLTRVVDFEGQSFLTSSHRVPLRPSQALDVAETIRRVVRRRDVVPPERLREPKIARRMLDEWGETVARLSIPPTLTNTDGEVIVFTVDRWAIAEGSRESIAAHLRQMENVAEDYERFFFLKDVDGEDGPTIAGSVMFDERAVRLETNSIEHADMLRVRIEAACGDLLGARLRSHSDPASMFGDLESTAETAANEAGYDAESSAEIRITKERHYATWPDEPLPALHGRTPREAVRSREGRRRVEALLNDLELVESTFPERERFDVAILRAALEP